MTKNPRTTRLEKPGDWIEFTVWGKPRGYVRMTYKGKWGKASKRYHEYMKDVQRTARAAGLILPLEACEGEEIMVRTCAVFTTRVHPDPENVQKGCVDALFYNSKSGDKYVGGCYAYPKYDDTASVTVSVERVKH